MSRLLPAWFNVDPLTFWDIFFGVVILLLVLEATRRIIGLPMALVIAFWVSRPAPQTPRRKHLFWPIGSIRRFHTGSFSAWLYRIVTNVCYDALRYQKRRPAVPFTHMSDDGDDHEFDLPAHEEGPETLLQRHELGALLQRHISALPADQRTVLVLSDVQGFSDQEIASIMRSNIGTVKSRLSRARAKLRRSLSSALLTL